MAGWMGEGRGDRKRGGGRWETGNMGEKHRDGQNGDRAGRGRSPAVELEQEWVTVLVDELGREQLAAQRVQCTRCTTGNVGKTGAGAAGVRGGG